MNDLRTYRLTLVDGSELTVVAYVRVSTERQAGERAYGLSVQRQAITRWAARHGHRIVSVHADEGVSGSLAERAGRADALDALVRHDVEGLVIPRLDRLARDLVVQESLLAVIRRTGKAVFLCSPSEDPYLADDPGDPSRRLIRQILGAVGEYERVMITLRLQGGRRRKAQRWLRQRRTALRQLYRRRCPRRRPRRAGHHRARRRTSCRRRLVPRDRADVDRRGHCPKRGGAWHPMVVKRALARGAA